jgi:hypothetical protein
MDEVIRKVFKMLRNHFKGFSVILGKLDLFPKIFRGMGSFNSFDVQVTAAIMFSYGCVPTIRQRTGTSDTKASDIVRILAKCSLFGYLYFEGAKFMVNDLPNDGIMLHIEIFFNLLGPCHPAVVSCKIMSPLPGWVPQILGDVI